MKILFQLRNPRNVTEVTLNPNKTTELELFPQSNSHFAGTHV